MTPHKDVFQAIPFNASNDANAPLIVAVGDAEEGEDRQLEAKAFSSFKFSALLLGLFLGFFSQFSILGALLSLIAFWDEDISMTNIVVFSLLSSFFVMGMAIAVLGFLRNLVTITYSAAGGRSKDMVEEMVMHMEYYFCAGVCLAWTMTLLLLGTRAQIVVSLVLSSCWRSLSFGAKLWCSDSVIDIDSKLSLTEQKP